jgi:quinolinate synthase
MILWPGTCIVHEQFSVKKIVQLRERHPNARLIAHPECEEPVLRMADFIGSTAALLKYVETERRIPNSSSPPSPASCTPCSASPPAKLLIPARRTAIAPATNVRTCARTPSKKLYLCLRDRTPEITLDPSNRSAALSFPIERMLAMS